MIWKEFKENFVALLSLAIAILTLLHVAWRLELTEKNNSIRVASFEILKNLGELQIIVNETFYEHKSIKGDLYAGWGHIALITDLGELLPSPIPEQSQLLLKAWSDNWKELDTNENAATQVTQEIDAARQAIVHTIRGLR